MSHCSCVFECACAAFSFFCCVFSFIFCSIMLVSSIDEAI